MSAAEPPAAARQSSPRSGPSRRSGRSGRAVRALRAVPVVLADRELMATLAVALLVEAGLALTSSRVPRALRLSLARLARWCGTCLDLAADPADTTADLTSGQDETTAEAALLADPGVRRRVHAVDAVLRRWPAGDTCLRRCLVLGHRLRSLQPRLRLGAVARDDGRLGAHAWLVVAGVALGDPLEDGQVLRSAASGPAR